MLARKPKSLAILQKCHRLVLIVEGGTADASVQVFQVLQHCVACEGHHAGADR